METPYASLTALLSVLVLSCCSLHHDGTGANPLAKDDWALGPFTKGNFIPDEKPLSSKNINDLREVALSIPVWESDWKASEEWVYKYSTSGSDVDEWTNPADGAQSAVTIRRMEKSQTGRMQIRVDRLDCERSIRSSSFLLPRGYNWRWSNNRRWIVSTQKYSGEMYGSWQSSKSG